MTTRPKLPVLTLLREGNALADPAEQVRFLNSASNLQRFDTSLAEHGLPPLIASGIEVLQVNVGKLCNQTCRHCHVDAGPDRREVMTAETAAACVRVLADHDIGTLDITGGAPEMCPQFRGLVIEARRLGRRVIDRCNLTILLAAGYTELPEFLAQHQVEVVASLPCYSAANTDAQRGDGVFNRSIAALERLNAVGYGRPDSGLKLTLVYNPLGASLPPEQSRLEADYRRELGERFGIVFNQLFTITNLPISRFLDDLIRNEKYHAYMHTLVDAFNPLAAGAVMCRTMISVGWDGRLYDCDFNQMLELDLAPGQPRTIHEFDLQRLQNRAIVTGRHCYGCTAGAGSSCSGIIANQPTESH